MAILAPFPAPLHLKSFIDVHISAHTLSVHKSSAFTQVLGVNEFLPFMFFFLLFFPFSDVSADFGD